MASEHISGQYNETDKKILRAFIATGKDETTVRELWEISGRSLQQNAIFDRADGPLRPVLLIFGSGICKIPFGKRAEFEALCASLLASEPSVPAHVHSMPAAVAPAKLPTAPAFKLLRWQEKALERWEQSNRRGIIEAVTGSGKTYLGIGVIKRLLESKHWVSPLVAVPTIPIMDQWAEKLSKVFPSQKIVQIGGGHKGDFSSPSTVAAVAVINSLVLNDGAKLNSLLAHCRNGRTRSLLIADECHHYIDAPVFNRLLQFPFDWTLGMSATVGPHEDRPYEIDGLGRVIMEYRFKDAHRDGLVPSFDLVNADISLTSGELRRYLAIDEQLTAQWRTIFLQHPNLSDLDGDALWDRLRSLMGRFGSHREPSIEKLFLLFFRRAEISYMADRKMELAEKLVQQLVRDQRKKVLVFFERIASAEQVGENVTEQASRILLHRIRADHLIACSLYHSRMKRAEREAVLEAFRKSGPAALLACRGLDEGLDIPDVDAAILVSSTQSLRQRIQRIGRVLRSGNGSKKPLVVTLAATGTSDQNVTSNDQTLFEGVATISCVKGCRAAMTMVQKLQ